ncbi:MAG: hypothetical protein AAF736_07780 [Pseudomonadota bacterium]
MNKPKETISDIDLLMLYYGEHDDPSLAARVASDPELSARLEALSQGLARIEQAPLPAPGPDYPQQVWQRLVPELGSSAASSAAPASRWRRMLLAPRFSLAGIAALLMVGVVAFMMGQTMNRPAEPTLALDAQTLLMRELALHLQQAELLLTEVANNGPATASLSASAQPLLKANRLYRIAGGSQVSQPLSLLLQDMEALLLELANAQDTQELGPVRDYVDSDLLFRVRALRHSLTEENRI